MHPILMQEVARYRQADLLREAERARLAYQATHDEDAPRRRFRLRVRRPSAVASLNRPALG